MITRAIIQPFVHMLLAGALLFLIAAVIGGRFVEVVKFFAHSPLDVPLWIWSWAVALALFFGTAWSLTWLWFKRSEKRCLDALDQR